MIETPSGNLSRIMRHINGAYTTYFNTKRQRAGHLFQGRYKAIVVEADAYAAELSRYIHLNPVRAGLLHRPEEYPWSSYRAYIGRCLPPDWQTTSLVLGYFGGETQEARNRYRKFVEDGILCDCETPLKNTVGSTVLGTPEFVEMITSERLPKHGDVRDIPAIRQLTPGLSPNETLEKIEACFGQTGRLLRDLTLWCSREYSGAKLKEIGERFGLSDAAVSQACRRLTLRAKTDLELMSLLERADDLFRNVKS